MEIENKHVVVLFDDLSRFPSRHIGVVRSKDSHFLYITIDSKNIVEAIPLDRIVRIEVVE